MGNANHGGVGPIRLRRYTWALVGLWTAAVGAATIWDLIDEHNHVLEIAREQARSAVEKNLLFRRWAATHGGVYVPVTPQTQPNPDLADSSERDIVTPSGRRLTLMNPAYMMRQVNELAGPEHWLHNRLTSLHPINPINRPDPWEAENLKAFEEGLPEASSIETVNGQPYMRLMWPVFTEDSCLTCHAEQGYRPGQIRGGMSVSVAIAPLEKDYMSEVAQRALRYCMVWLLGVGGIVLGSRHLQRQVERRQRAEEALRETETQVKQIAAHIPGVVYQFLLHPDGGYSLPYVSEGLTEILGVTPDDARRDPASVFPDRFVEEDLDSIWQSIRESADKMSTWEREMRCTSAHGEDKWIRATASPHRMPDGGVLFNGVLLDITDHKQADRKLQEAHDLLERRVAERTADLETANRELHREIAERKQAEKWLMESEERFRGFFELGVVGMAVVSPEGDWEEANDRLRAILGYSQEELLGKTWADLIHPDDRQVDQEQFSRALAGAIGGYSAQRRLVRKDGQPVHAQLSVRCLRRADGAVDSLIVLVQDITEHMRAVEQCRVARRTLPDPESQ